MNIRHTVLFVPWLLCLAGSAVAQTQSSTKAALDIKITPLADHFRVGDPIPLKLLMTNVSDHEVLLIEQPVSGPVFRNLKLRDMDIRVVDAGGRVAPETEYGKTIHGRSLAPDPTGPGLVPPRGPRGFGLSLMPGKSMTEESDLSKEFDLSKPGRYIVQAHTAGKDRDSGTIVYSNKITITVE